MNTLFIHSTAEAQSADKPLRTAEAMQFGISQISALLKSHGHETRLLVLGAHNGRANERIIERHVTDFDPPLICFTAVFSQYPFVAAVARHIRSRWGGRFLCIGGPHASLNPREVMGEAFDAVCVGEGEYPTLELISQLQRGRRPTGIANLWLRQADGTIQEIPPRPFLADLDRLPPPDREMWRPWVSEQSGARLAVLLGRGCPFTCTYCCNHALRKLAPGRYVRLRSPGTSSPSCAN